MRGTSGPIHVTVDPNPNAYAARYLAAAESVGIPRTKDYNGVNAEGVGPMQQNIYQGQRQSTANTYLTPAVRARKNLTIATYCQALRVVVAGNIATGVEFKYAPKEVAAMETELISPFLFYRRGATKDQLRASPIQVVHAKREVLLAGGAVGSPTLLLHSGIGPANELAAAGVPVACNLPGVGKNLRDHVMLLMMFETTDNAPLNEAGPVPRLLKAFAEYTIWRTGMLANAAVPVTAFLRSGVNPEVRGGGAHKAG